MYHHTRAWHAAFAGLRGGRIPAIAARPGATVGGGGLMVCDTCRERDAVVHLTQIVESIVSQVHLCEQCAAARGIETTAPAPKHPLGDFLQAVQQQAAQLEAVALDNELSMGVGADAPLSDYLRGAVGRVWP